MSIHKQPKRYTASEYYEALVKQTRSVGQLMKNRKHQRISQDFIERIMLSVTEVNGCAICAYGHTRMALSQGFTQDEITSFLSGSATYVTPEEAKAIFFAQHYADTKGYVDPLAYAEVVQTYGDEKTRIILAAIQMMMVGNIAGLPISAFIRRWKGKKDPQSHLMTELGLPSLTLVFLIPAFVQGRIETRFKQPSLNFANKTY